MTINVFKVQVAFGAVRLSVSVGSVRVGFGAARQQPRVVEAEGAEVLRIAPRPPCALPSGDVAA